MVEKFSYAVYDSIQKHMKQFDFVFKHKKHSDLFSGTGDFSGTYNYVFEKCAHDALMDK